MEKISLLAQMAYLASYSTRIPLSFGISIEVISSLQVLYMVLNTSFIASEDQGTIIFHGIRDLLSYISFSSILTLFDTKAFKILVWSICSLYLLIYFVFTIILTVLQYRKIEVSGKVKTSWTQINFLHAKMFFCPISYFYLRFIFEENNQNNKSGIGLPFCETCFDIGTIVFLLINLLFASLKEIFCYQTYKSKKSYGVKTNFHSMIQLTHKAFILPLIIFLNPDLQFINAALNVIFTLINLIWLFVGLPFYSKKCLKIIVLLSTISTTFSFVFFLKFIIKSHHPMTFEFFACLFAPLMVKLMCIKLEQDFRRMVILGGISPRDIVHFMYLYDEWSHGNKKLKHGDLSIQGLISLEEKKNFKHSKDYNNRVYVFLIDKVLSSHKKHPKSPQFLLLLIQLYMGKVQNILNAMIYIQKANKLSLSTSESAALMYLRNKLQKKVDSTYQENHEFMNSINYFKYQEYFTTFSDIIQKDVNLHIRFWETFSNKKVDVYEVLEISKQSDVMTSRIEKFWMQNKSEFQNNYIISILVYKIYLSIVKGLPHLSQIVVNELYGTNHNFMNFLQKWIDQEKASIIISNQPETLGRVLKASNSVKNLFNISKDELIGKKVNMLMPQMIAEKHDDLIKRFNRRSGYELSFDTEVYCKTLDGNFFSCNLRGRIYSDIRDFGLIGTVIKKKANKFVLFVDIDGVIKDCSKNLMQIFGIDILSEDLKIQQIAPELDVVNTAFNMVYSLQKFSGTIQTQKKYETDFLHSCRNHSEKYELRSGEESNRNKLYSEVLCLIGKETLLNSPTLKTEFQVFSSPHDNKRILLLDSLETGQFHHKNKLQLDINEAESIVENFRKGKNVFFSPLRSDPKTTTIKYKVKVKDFLFQKQCFKIFELTRIEGENYPQNITPYSFENSPKMSYIDYGSQYHWKKERVQNIDNINSSNKHVPIIESKSYPERETINFRLNKPSSFNLKADNALLEKFEINLGKLNSVNVNQRSKGARIERKLDDLFGKEKQSLLLRIYIMFFYVLGSSTAIFFLLCFFVTRSSFEQTGLTAKLVNTESERILKLTSIWTIANSLYNTAIQETDPHSITYPQSILNQTISLREVTEQIVSLLDTLDSDDIIKEIFRKDIQFWGDNNSSPAYNSLIGINLVAESFTNLMNGSVRLELDFPLVMYTLNNSINDVFLSCEKELKIIQKVKKDIYRDNITLSEVFAYFQCISIGVIMFSITALAFKIHNSHRKLCMILYTACSKTINLRYNQLLCFTNWLKEKEGSSNLIGHFNDFLEEQMKMVEKSNTEGATRFQSKAFVTKIKACDVCFLIFAYIFFMVTFLAFGINALVWGHEIKELQYISQISQIAETMSYQTDLLNGNFLYWINFYNNSDMLVRNEATKTQLLTNLDILSSVNQQLVDAFDLQNSEFQDDVVRKLLFDNLCDSLGDIELCNEDISDHKNKGFGLLGLNMKYKNLLSYYMEEIQRNPSKETCERVIKLYLTEALPNKIVTTCL